MPRSRLRPLLVASALLGLAACGGNVVVDGGGGGSGAPPTGPGVTTGPGPATTSVSTGPHACDGTGFCGDPSQGCIACALAQQCAQAYAECQASGDCVDYSGCILPCQDEGCVKQCAASHPFGASLYNQLVACVVCDACVVDCAEIAGSTLGFPGCG